MMRHCIILSRGFVLLFVLSFLMILATGCGSSTKSEPPQQPPLPAAKTAITPPAEPSQNVARTALQKPKIIESAQVTLETRDLSATEKAASEMLGKRNGKIDSSSVATDGSGRRSGTYTYRIPAGQLQDYIKELSELPDVVVRQRSLSAQDVTEEFVDISARLENMRLHETRLREILSKANTVDEILKVEKELASVRGQIESTTGRLNLMTGKIEMSTLQLRISEVSVNAETHFFGKLKSIIRDSWIAAGDVVLYLIAAVIVSFPILLLIAAILWWRNRRNRKLSSAQPNINVKPPVDP